MLQGSVSTSTVAAPRKLSILCTMFDCSNHLYFVVTEEGKSHSQKAQEEAEAGGVTKIETEIEGESGREGNRFCLLMVS